MSTVVTVDPEGDAFAVTVTGSQNQVIAIERYADEPEAEKRGWDLRRIVASYEPRAVA